MCEPRYGKAEAKNTSNANEITYTSRNPKVHCLVHSNPPL